MYHETPDENPDDEFENAAWTMEKYMHSELEGMQSSTAVPLLPLGWVPLEVTTPLESAKFQLFHVSAMCSA